LIALLGKQQPPARAQQAPAEVLVNGRSVATLDLPGDDRAVTPIAVDPSQHLTGRRNQVELRSAGASKASAQLISSYYAPWAQGSASTDAGKESGPAATLGLRVSFDKTEAVLAAAVTCTVAAERVGFHGYGMMLAEIGLPPGADVDRASLDRAVKASGWAINQYDILPDKVVVYLWPQAGGAQFEFKFRPRFGLAAQTAPSLLYDYYNPEARAVVGPTRFIVRDK
jgi:hypothetical protein